MTTRCAASPRANGMRRAAPSAREHQLAQFHDIWSGNSPERELAAAVLETAAADLQSCRYAGRRRRQWMYWQAYEWVASIDREWPFSFVNICELLRISPEALRTRLLSPGYGQATKAHAA